MLPGTPLSTEKTNPSPIPSNTPNNGLALALSSSYFGFYTHAGFLAELAAQGVVPGAVSGSSAGGLVAGLHAGGLSPEEILPLLTDLDLFRTFHDWALPIRATKLLFNRPGTTGAILPARAVRQLRTILQDRRIEDCHAPRLALAVTNLTRQHPELITRGPLADFILASCALPGLFAAHTIDGQLYWDGGIAQPAPLAPWIDDPAIHTILVHFVHNHDAGKKKPQPRPLTIYAGICLIKQIVHDELHRLQARLAREAGKNVIVLETTTPRPGFFRRQLGPDLIQLGRETVRRHSDLLQPLRQR